MNSQSSGFVYGSETMGNKSSRITFTTLTVVNLPTWRSHRDETKC